MGDPVNRKEPRGLDICDDDPAACDGFFADPYGENNGSSVMTPDCGLLTLDYIDNELGDSDDSSCFAAPVETSVPSTPNCEQQIQSSIDSFLTSKGSPLAGYGSWFVSVGEMDNVDPRLLVAIAGNESGYGTSPVAQKDDNAFGVMSCQRVQATFSCAPAQYSNFGQSISAAGGTLENQIYNPNKLNNTVSLLYSGKPGAYCVNTLTVPCSGGAGNVTQILSGLGGNQNSLGFPCPPDD
jgi:hypothetical protein